MSSTRSLRIGLSLLLLTGVAALLAPYATSYVSTSAVVNAPLITLRAPFDGRIREASPATARPVAAHAPLGLFEGARQDQGVLAGLIAQDRAAAGAIAAIAAEEAALRALSAEIERREEQYRAQGLAANRAAQQEILARIRASNAEGQEIVARVARSRPLVQENARPPALLEQETSQLSVNQAERAALMAQLEAARIRGRGLESGLLPGTAGEDAYGRQRRDEIAMRLATLGTEAARLAAERQALAGRIAVAEAAVAAHERFVPVSGTGAVVWRASAAPGTELLAGDEILKLVDCEHRFIEVTVAERHFGTIAPGTRAIVRLMGSEAPFAAVVDAVQGSGAKPEHPDLAAAPDDVPAGQLRVILRLAPPAGEEMAMASFCDVGRTAEVRFERSLGADLRGLRRLARGLEDLVEAALDLTLGRTPPALPRMTPAPQDPDPAGLALAAADRAP